MIKTFTQDDVIRYLYKEVTIEESNEMEQAMICDSELQETFKKFSTLKRQLNAVIKTPSQAVSQSILNYSKNFNLHSLKE